MFKKIVSLFSTKDEQIEEEEEVQQEVQEIQLPDQIEVPKEIAIIPVNLDLAVEKTFKDYKEFLFESKMKERKYFEVVEKLKKVKEDRIEEIKEKFLGDKKDDYEFEYPKGTGKPGILKKKNISQQS